MSLFWKFQAVLAFYKKFKVLKTSRVLKCHPQHFVVLLYIHILICIRFYQKRIKLKQN